MDVHAPKLGDGKARISNSNLSDVDMLADSASFGSDGLGDGLGGEGELGVLDEEFGVNAGGGLGPALSEQGLGLFDDE